MKRENAIDPKKKIPSETLRVDAELVFVIAEVISDVCIVELEDVTLMLVEKAAALLLEALSLYSATQVPWPFV